MRKINPSHKCIDCGKSLNKYADSLRCLSCHYKTRKGSGNSQYIDGRSKKKYYCKDCGNLIHFSTACYKTGLCLSCSRKGKRSPNFGGLSNKNIKELRKAIKLRWKNIYDKGLQGRFNNKGYYYIKVPSHPYARKDNYVAEHRLVMEKHLGRYLKPEELIHHINGIRNDNRIENLALVTRKTHEIGTFVKLIQKRVRYLENKIKRLKCQN